MGEISLWLFFLKYTMETIIFMSKMSLKYVSIQGMIMNMKLSSHDFFFFTEI